MDSSSDRLLETQWNKASDAMHTKKQSQSDDKLIQHNYMKKHTDHKETQSNLCRFQVVAVLFLLSTFLCPDQEFPMFPHLSKGSLLHQISS